MTIPSTIILPNPRDNALESIDTFKDYQKEMIYTLERMYEEVAQGINGDIRNDTDFGNRQFKPTVSGTTAAGVGTYTHQTGSVLRQGLMVDVFFDVLWTGHTGTGNLYLDLPYKVALSNEKPFVGVLQVSNLTFTGSYCVINAIPDTRRGELWTCTTAAATSNVAMDTAGQILGHIKYVGQAIERD